MTVSCVPDGAAPLSPLQRAGLAYAKRPIAVTIDTPLSPTMLLVRAESALGAMPHLGAELWWPPASRVPYQRLVAAARDAALDGTFRLSAGALTVDISAGGSGSRLKVTADALFVDAASIERLCAALARDDGAGEAPNFLDIVAEHCAMLRDGDLEQERAFWRSPGEVIDPRPVLGVEPRPEREAAPAVARLPIALPGSARLVASAGVGLEDLAYLALCLLVDRVCPTVARVGRIVDARGVMGLDDVAGVFTQIAPDAAEIDPQESAATLLACQSKRLRRYSEMAGGPALAEGDDPPTLVFQSYTVQRLPEGWHVFETCETRSGAVLLSASADGEGLALAAAATDGTEEPALRRLLEAWAEILAALVREPTTPWRDLRLDGSSTGEVGARTEPAEAEDLCVRIRAFAAADPDAPAVRCGERLLSRRGLIERVGAILAALGSLDQGAVVAVLAGPEPDLLASWLAALWRGAAFLPLSPSEPAQRIADALTLSCASIVLVGTGVSLPDAPPSCRVVALAEVGPAAVDPGTPIANAGDTAYLLRTSGSTGSPKLVAVGRRSLNNYLRWAAEDLLSDDGDAMPVVSSPIFDASFKQLLGPQFAGRPTWLLVDDPSDAARAFCEFATAAAPFSLNCTPTYWAELLDLGTSAPRRPPISRLMLGGEAISDGLLERTQAQYPDAEVWNFYGPTETTATATVGLLAPGRPVHAGRPIAGAVVVVADRYSRPLPLGLSGEIWIAGPGVARGYVVPVEPTPFITLELGGRATPAYRTGDLGRFEVDGNLTVAGRVDGQLKLRGWRIEPGEIERVACKASGLTTAKLVVDRRDDAPRLRLFYTGDADETEVAGVLRAWLPVAMIPATVTRVTRFPRTGTGKLDEAGLLQAVAAHKWASPDEYETLELEVATVWRELLGGGWPRPDEDFFNAGGHSLLLARLVNQLRARGRESISLRLVVRSPSVRSIAKVMHESAAATSDAASRVS